MISKVYKHLFKNFTADESIKVQMVRWGSWSTISPCLWLGRISMIVAHGGQAVHQLPVL